MSTGDVISVQLTPWSSVTEKPPESPVRAATHKPLDVQPRATTSCAPAGRATGCHVEPPSADTARKPYGTNSPPTAALPPMTHREAVHAITRGTAAPDPAVTVAHESPPSTERNTQATPLSVKGVAVERRSIVHVASRQSNATTLAPAATTEPRSNCVNPSTGKGRSATSTSLSMSLACTHEVGVGQLVTRDDTVPAYDEVTTAAAVTRSSVKLPRPRIDPLPGNQGWRPGRRRQLGPVGAEIDAAIDTSQASDDAQPRDRAVHLRIKE